MQWRYYVVRSISRSIARTPQRRQHHVPGPSIKFCFSFGPFFHHSIGSVLPLCQWWLPILPMIFLFPTVFVFLPEQGPATTDIFWAQFPSQTNHSYLTMPYSPICPSLCIKCHRENARSSLLLDEVFFVRSSSFFTGISLMSVTISVTEKMHVDRIFQMSSSSEAWFKDVECCSKHLSLSEENCIDASFWVRVRVASALMFLSSLMFLLSTSMSLHSYGMSPKMNCVNCVFGHASFCY